MKAARGQGGFTLVELLVAVVIVGVLGGIVVNLSVNSQRAFVRADDETRGLGEAMLVLGEVARDVRTSGGVLCDGGLADPGDPSSSDPYCGSHLQLWIDSDSDYVSEPSESITWFLRSDDDHFNVVRIDGAGMERVLARSLVTRQLFFTYDTQMDPTGAQVVTISMTYDPRQGMGTEPRNASTSARIRNGRLS